MRQNKDLLSMFMFLMVLFVFCVILQKILVLSQNRMNIPSAKSVYLDTLNHEDLEELHVRVEDSVIHFNFVFESKCNNNEN